MKNRPGVQSETINTTVPSGGIQINYNMSNTANQLRVVNITTGETLFDTANLGAANAMGEVQNKVGSGAIVQFDSQNDPTSFQVVVGDGVTPGDVYLKYKVILLNSNSNVEINSLNSK